MNILHTLRERGFVKQCTDEGTVRKLLKNNIVKYYAGFDPTADSLHVGSLLPIMAMAHLQKSGHFPIAIIGGGTTMIGDPSGKTEMRQLLNLDNIKSNGQKILKQLEKYLVLDGNKGLFLNNDEWLLNLNYIDFLREIGSHFRVNEMLRSEAYKLRLEREDGLSFIEFNYQLLQAYDFLYLSDKYDCILQIGGDDQWGNILAGTELIRKVRSKDSFGLTLPLLSTAKGEKMGKTHSGAIWLDPEKTPSYDFYQYWINTDDRDVEKFLAFFTFLSIEEIDDLSTLKGQDLNKAKEILAFEATKITHGLEEAEKAKKATKSFFQNEEIDLANIPKVTFEKNKFNDRLSVVELLFELKLFKSKNEIRRLIEQGGAYINNNVIQSVNYLACEICLNDDSFIFRQGKNKYTLIKLI